MDKINVKDIIESNSNIDKGLFLDGIKKIKKLRELGVAKSNFNLELPYSQKLKHEDDDSLVCKF